MENQFVQIKLFGKVAEVAGTDELNLPLEKASTCHALAGYLHEKYPLMKSIKFAIAVNLDIALPETRIHSEDEIAILPPFSGG